MLQGVGCSGGVDPSYDQPAVQAADRGERARGLMQAAVLAWDSSRSSSSSKQPVLPAALTERLSEQEQDELLQQARLRVEEMRQVGLCRSEHVTRKGCPARGGGLGLRKICADRVI